MPYIKQADREQYNGDIKSLARQLGYSNRSGHLNYVITRLVNAYLGRAPNYDDYNTAIGVLECAKLELYRRRVAKYEDTKLVLNGDVCSGREV